MSFCRLMKGFLRPKYIFEWLLIGLVGVLPLCVRGEEAETANEEPIQIPNRTLKVGFYQQIGYYDCRDTVPIGGYGYDYLQYMRRYAPWQYVYCNLIGKNWAVAAQLLKSGEIDLLAHVRKTPEREAEFSFSKYPSGQSANVLTVKSGDVRFHAQDYAHWDGMRIGVLRAGNYQKTLEELIAEKGFQPEIVFYDDAVQMHADLQAGGIIDAMLFHNLRKLSDEWVIFEWDAAPFYIAVRKGDFQTLDELNKAQEMLVTIEPGLPGKLRQKNCAAHDNEAVQYTEDERAFIHAMQQKKHVFKAILNPDRYPLAYYTPSGHKGIVKDVVDEMIRRTGLAIELLPVATQDAYQAAFNDPATDFVFDLKNDLFEAEQRDFVLSNPYLTLKTFLVRNTARSKVKKLALIKHYLATERIKPLLSNTIEVQYCNSTNEAIDRVVSGQCDATCLYPSAAELAVHNDLSGKLCMEMLPKVDIQLAVGTRDDRNPLLIAIINKAVDSISDEYIVEQIQKSKPSQDLVWSAERIIHNYPTLVYGVPLLLLFFICAFLLYLLRARRNDYCMGEVFKKMPLRYFFADANGKLLKYDYGNAKKPLFKSLDDVKDDKVRLPMQKMVADALREGKPQSCIYEDAGRIRSVIVSPVSRELFGRPAVVGISRDITDVQKTYEDKRKNEEYFRMTLQSIGDGVIATDKNGAITMLNVVAEAMMGVKQTDVMGKPHVDCFKIVSAEDDQPLESPLVRTLRSGHLEGSGHHTVLLSCDGVRRYHITDRSSPIRDDHDAVIGAILVFHDITEEYVRSKHADDELAKWAAAAKIAQLYSFSYDTETQRVSTTGSISEVWPVHDGLTIAPEKWICAEDYPEWHKTFAAIADGTLRQASVEYRVHDNGKIRYFRGFMRGSRPPEHAIIGLIQEITAFVEDKQKQNALQTLWATCRELMPITLFIKDALHDFRYVQCNKAFAECIGRSEEEIVGRTDAELLKRPEDAALFRENDQRIMAGGAPVEMHESMICGDGKMRHYMTVKIPTTGLDGNPVLLGMSLDETEEYVRREKLDRMLDEWETVADVARIATYRLDRNMRVISQSNRISEFWPVDSDGIPLAEELYLRQEDVEPYRKMYDDLFSGRTSNGTVLCHVPQPNGMRCLRLYVKRDKVHPDEILGLIQDVTERVLEQNKRDALLRMWRNVVDTLPALFFVKNADDDFRYVQGNDKFSQLRGFSADEVIGHTEEEFLSNIDEARENRLDDMATIKSGKRQDYLKKIHGKDGQMRHYRTVKIPSVDENGHRLVIAMSQDITEEQQLAETRRIITTAFETLFSSDNLADDLRIILKEICALIQAERAYICCEDEETNGVTIFSSYCPPGMKSMYDFTNFRIEHACTFPWYARLINSMRDDVFSFDFANAAERAQAKTHVPSILDMADMYDIRGIHLNYVTIKGKLWGSIGFISCGHPLKKLTDNEKRLLRVCAHLLEQAVTRKRTLDQLQNALTNALAADKAKNYFLSSMSHEIRTPLNAVIGFTDLLKDRELDEKTREEYLEAVGESSNALLNLLNDILELSKLASGHASSHPVRTDMAKFILEMDSMFQPVAMRKELTLDFVADEIPVLYIDQPQLRQIFFNLIGNAIKFTKKGGIKVTVTFEQTRKTEGILTVHFVDTGVGIPLVDRDKLFEPFIQLSKMRGTNASGSGTGLGLPIVKKTVDQLGGTLSMSSEIDKGTTFTIVLPHVSTQSLREDDVPPENAGEVPFAPIAKTVQPNAPRVLIVDDSEMALEILSRMLYWMHVPHTRARSAKEALELFQSQSFDRVLTDILMPEVNGVELAQSIRALPQGTAVRIIAMSTENESILYDRNLFDKVMLKPIVRNVLYDEIFGKGTGDGGEK